MTADVIRLLAAEGEAKGRDLPLEPWAIGLCAFGLLCVALLVTLSFGKDR
jgi:hypothetical protein